MGSPGKKLFELLSYQDKNATKTRLLFQLTGLVLLLLPSCDSLPNFNILSFHKRREMKLVDFWIEPLIKSAQGEYNDTKTMDKTPGN